jgi:hypothetical protein
MKASTGQCNSGFSRRFFRKKKGMGRLFFVFYLSFTVGFLAGQGSNPFDISSRTPVQRTEIKGQTEDSVRAGLPVKQEVQTEATVARVMQGRDEIGVTASSTGRVVGSNPFDVDHIPFLIARKEAPVIKQEEGNKNPEFILFWMLLLSCAFLAIAINGNPKYCMSVYHAVWNDNLLRLFQREYSGRLTMTTLLLYLVFVMNAGAFVYFVPAFHLAGKGIAFWGVLCCFFAALYLVRHGGLFLFGRIFLVSRYTALFSFTTMVFNFFSGVLLIPFNFLLAFGPEGIREIVLVSALVLLGFFFVFRYFRGLMIISDYLPDRFFQIILYLCAFELSPLLILLKTITVWGQNV